MDPKRLGELRKLVDGKNGKGNVAVLARELCGLVAASGTDNEGMLRAAEALKEQPAQEVIVQVSDLSDLLKTVAPPAPPANGGSSGGSSAAKPEK